MDDLQLRTGVDIPFPQARVSIHNPVMTEIGTITEPVFHTGVQFLNFSKNVLNDLDKTSLENKTDFDIFMSIMLNKKEKLEYKNNALMVLSLLFPGYLINLSPKEGIELIPTSDNKSREPAYINKDNFEEFKALLVDTFVLKSMEYGGAYNPADKMAAKIAEKLMKGKQKKQQPGGNEKLVIYGKYISILTVGEHKNMKDFDNYTVYALIDEFQRFLKNEDYKIYVKAKMAGAQNMKEVENWME